MPRSAASLGPHQKGPPALTRTSASTAVDRSVGPDRPDASADDADPGAGGAATDRGVRSTRGPWSWVGALAALLAVLCAVVLPVAPVSVNDPVVTWPRAGAAPSSTSLELTRYTPRSFEVSFTCHAAAIAAAAAPVGTPGLVLATIRPGDPDATVYGLLAQVVGGRLQVRVHGTTLVDTPLPTGTCRVQVAGDGAGVHAGIDGRTVGRGPHLPEVDALITGLDGRPGVAAGDLSARIRVDDQFSSAPTPLKVAVMVLLGVGVVLALIAAWRLDRATGRSRAPRAPTRAPGGRGLLPYLVDLAVVAVMAWWVVIAPLTADDGYYNAMAKNARFGGYVSQYYQLYNQSFTPFSWWYYVLGRWQDWFGFGPVVVRIPALIAGLVTWWSVRWYCHRRSAARERDTPPTVWRTVVIALAFLAWWLAYDMGVRPEPFAAAAGGVVLVGATLAAERRRLLPLGVALLAAAVGVTTHPSGFTAVAPLIALAPALWRTLRGPGRLTTAVRLLVAVAPAAVGSVLAFADSGLYDFTRSQALFLGIQAQDDWTDEINRYWFLLSDPGMGNYAKRAPVLLAVVALVAIGATTASAALRRRIDPRARTAAWTLAVALLLFWLTPSKWTHHFGAIAALGPVVVAMALLTVAPVVRGLAARRAVGWTSLVVAAGAVVLAAALAFRGPNVWPPYWEIGVPHADKAPYLTASLRLGGVTVWVVVALVSTAAALVLGRVRRRGATDPAATRTGPAATGPARTRAAVARGAAATAVVLLAVDTAYLVGDFTVSEFRPTGGWSLARAYLTDPTGQHACDAAGTVEVTDARRPTALPPVPGTDPAAATGFVRGSGWFLDDAPPFTPSTGTAPAVWGSLVPNGTPALDPRAESTFGTLTSGWYALPATASPSAVAVVMAAGRLTDGNRVTVDYGDDAGRVVGTQVVEDQAPSPDWRTFVLDRQAAGSGATRVRITAADGSAGVGGWLAVAAPALQPVQTVQQLMGRTAAVGVSWQIAFDFPCQRQPRQQYGINEPVVYGIGAGDRDLSVFGDATFLRFRGGLFGRLQRGSAVTQLVTYVPSDPSLTKIQAYLYQRTYPAAAYDLRVGRETVSGLSGPSLPGGPSSGPATPGPS